jgi:putative membrane protein
LLLTFIGVFLYALGFEQVIALTPLFLLMNLGLMWYQWKGVPTLFKAWSIAYVIGFTSELIGVKTGLLFGDYVYGSVLGPSLFGVPLMVGALWALVASSIWSCLPAELGLRRVPFMAVIAVAYDIILEHFAVRFGLWAWEGSIPLSNALGWFLVSGLIGLLYHRLSIMLPRTEISTIILPVHTLFFIFLILL